MVGSVRLPLDRWLNDYKKTRLSPTTWETYETTVTEKLKKRAAKINDIPLNGKPARE